MRCRGRVREGVKEEEEKRGRGGSCRVIVIVAGWNFMLRRRMRMRMITSSQSLHLGWRRKMYFHPPPPPSLSLCSSLFLHTSSIYVSSPIPILRLTYSQTLTTTPSSGPSKMVPPRLGNQISGRSLRLQFLPPGHGPRSPSLGLHPPFPYPPARRQYFRSPPRRALRREGKHDNNVKNVFAYSRRETGVLRAVRRDGVLVA